MDEDRIRRHLDAARHDDDIDRLASRVTAFCWPGGSEDRSEPGALAWVRRWRPATAAAVLPVCSCAAGNCAVCN